MKHLLLATLTLSAALHATNQTDLTPTVAQAEAIFEAAWNNPAYTQIALNDIDINEVLRWNYLLSQHHPRFTVNYTLQFNRDMLWDMEQKKAWNPQRYIPYVVRKAKSWNKKTFENGDVTFVRSSEQKQWLNPATYETVFEEVYINARDKKITFLGTTQLIDETGKEITLSNKQPLFHVEHSAKGTHDRPLNGWRIVLLTPQKDQAFIDFFKYFNDTSRLPGFLEIYIKEDLNMQLQRMEQHIAIA